LDETGYVLELHKEGTEEAMARVENLEEFNSLLQEFEEDQFEELPEEEQKAKKPFLLPLFIEASSLASDIDQLDGYAPSVKLMTLHSSKGLEFPVVFIVGMEEGLFPSTKSWKETDEEDIEEERRLCYVGMTRARERLYLMNVLIRRIWGDVAYQEPSRFFQEIPDELMQFKDLASFGRAGTGSLTGRLGSSRQFGYRSSPAPRRALEYSQEVAPAEPRGGELVGQKLNHPEYGMGTILSVEGSGDDRKVTIEFRGRDRRKFLWRYLAAYFGD
jgi:DNA helicase-2/ATP-dependent DNA helicase PcrA